MKPDFKPLADRANRLGLVLALLACLLLPAVSTRAQEADAEPAGPPNGVVTLKHADGSTRATATYRDGLLNGVYRAHAENGQLVVQAQFKRGVLSARLQRWTPDGQRLEIASYREGVLHGERTVFDGRRPVLKEKYKEGELVDSEGQAPVGFETVVFLLENDPAALLAARFGPTESVPVAPSLSDTRPRGYPRSLSELKQGVDKIAEMEIKGVNTDEQAQAVRRTMLHRLVSGVPKYTLGHDPKDGEAAVIGSEVLSLIGDLTHHPDNPGMDEAKFKRGYFATSNGNIAYNSRPMTPAEAVDQWVIDRGDNNRDEVGHRRWIFEPGLYEIGYGSFENYYTMVVIPNFKRGARYSLISYPGQGYVPNDMVPGNCIWSAHPSPSQYKLPERVEDVEVSVFALSPDGRREAVELQRTHLTADMGIPVPAVLFEPVIDASEHNQRFEVHIDGLIPASRRMPNTLSYTVHFVDMQRVVEESKIETPEDGEQE